MTFGVKAFLKLPNNAFFPDESVAFDFKTTVPDGLLVYQGGVC